MDFSTDNEVTWQLLKVVEPNLEGEVTQTVTLELPPESKTNATIFRWWQPLGLGGNVVMFNLVNSNDNNDDIDRNKHISDDDDDGNDSYCSNYIENDDNAVSAVDHNNGNAIMIVFIIIIII